jgi:hypothetical protein
MVHQDQEWLCWELFTSEQLYRVPDARFRASYGQAHGFRFYSLPVMYVGGHCRFQYGGFWFGLVDRGRNTGQPIGMTTMTCMWITTVMDTICMIAGIRVIALLSAST